MLCSGIRRIGIAGEGTTLPTTYTNVVSGSNSNPQRIDKGLLVVGVGDYNFDFTGEYRFTATTSSTGFIGFASKGTLEDL
jgi:hypothetical protein